MDENDEPIALTPPEVKECAREVSLNLLPAKSRVRYEKTYTEFKDWCRAKRVNHCSETVLLAYFSEILKKGLCCLFMAQIFHVEVHLKYQGKH